MKLKIRTIEIYLLALLVALEAMGALYGGFNLINDPSGDSIGLPIELLENTIFPHYLIPGIILFLLLGFFPLFLVIPLLFKPNWPLIGHLNIYPGYHWAWTYTLFIAIILIIWINVQMMILSTGSMIQGLSGLWGVLILIVAMLPPVKRYYRIQTHSKRTEKEQK